VYIDSHALGFKSTEVTYLITRAPPPVCHHHFAPMHHLSR